MPLTDTQQQKAKKIAAQLYAVSAAAFERWQNSNTDKEKDLALLEQFSSRLESIIGVTFEFNSLVEAEFWHQLMVECKNNSDYITLTVLWDRLYDSFKDKNDESTESETVIIDTEEDIFKVNVDQDLKLLHENAKKWILHKISGDATKGKISIVTPAQKVWQDEARIGEALKMKAKLSEKKDVNNEVKPEIKSEARVEVKSQDEIVFKVKNVFIEIKKILPSYNAANAKFVKDLMQQYREKLNFLSSVLPAEVDSIVLIKNACKEDMADYERVFIAVYIDNYIHNKQHDGILAELLCKHIFKTHPWIEKFPAIKGKDSDAGDRILNFAGSYYPELLRDVYDKLIEKFKSKKEISDDEFENTLKLLRRASAHELCEALTGKKEPGEGDIKLAIKKIEKEGLSAAVYENWAAHLTAFCQQFDIPMPEQKAEPSSPSPANK